MVAEIYSCIGIHLRRSYNGSQSNAPPHRSMSYILISNVFKLFGLAYVDFKLMMSIHSVERVKQIRTSKRKSAKCHRRQKECQHKSNKSTRCQQYAQELKRTHNSIMCDANAIQSNENHVQVTDLTANAWYTTRCSQYSFPSCLLPFDSLCGIWFLFSLISHFNGNELIWWADHRHRRHV